ncbi:MAG: alpha/beta hydrolase [Pseudomonadota bacterium]
MPLHPFVGKMMDAARAANRPPLSGGTPQQARELVASGRQALGAGPDVGEVSDITVPTRAGAVPGRLYRSKNTEHGLLVYFHGGGWVCGTLDDFDILARSLVHASDCAVLMVDYRLAPEFAFPAGLEDAEDAIAWAAREVESLTGRRLPLAVGGDSAGGNLATAALNSLRGKVDCALQLLLYPVTDSDTGRASYIEHGEGLPLTRADMQWFLGHYAPRAMWADPRIAPLRHPALGGSPPAWIATAEYDVLRDEGEDYARRLQEAGVRVELHRVPGLAHGFARLTNLLEPVAALVAEAGEAVRRHCNAHAKK